MVVQLPNSAGRRVAPQEVAEAMASGLAVWQAGGGCGLGRGVGPDAGDEGPDESCGEPLWYGSVETKVTRECSHLVGVAPRLYRKFIVHGAMLTAKETL